MKASLRSIALVVATSMPATAGCESDDGGSVVIEAGEASSVSDAAQLDSPSADARADAVSHVVAVDGALPDARTADASSVDGPRAYTDAAVDAPKGADATLASDAPPDAAAVDASREGDAVTSTLIGLRVANWSPDAPPIDFCVAIHGSGVFRGPVLAGLAGEGTDGGPPFSPGLSLLPDSPPDSVPLVIGGSTTTSSYVLLAPGEYDVRVVVGSGGSGCTLGVAAGRGGDVSVPATAAGSTFTVALIGEANPVGLDPKRALQLVSFADDFVAPPQSKPDGAANASVAIRFVHAAPGVRSVDFGLDNGGAFNSIFSAVSYGTVDSSSDGGLRIDLAGYFLGQPPLSATSLRVRPTAANDAATPDLTSVSNVSVAAGSVVTFVLMGNPSLGGAPRLLQCIDNSGMNIDPSMALAPYSRCSLL